MLIVVKLCENELLNFFLTINPYLLFTSVIGLSGGMFGMALNYLLTMADPFEGMMRLSAVLNTHVGFHLDPFTCFCTCISEVL